MGHGTKQELIPVEESHDSQLDNRKASEPLGLWPHGSWILAVASLGIMRVLNGYGFLLYNKSIWPTLCIVHGIQASSHCCANGIKARKHYLPYSRAKRSICGIFIQYITPQTFHNSMIVFSHLFNCGVIREECGLTHNFVPVWPDRSGWRTSFIKHQL